MGHINLPHSLESASMQPQSTFSPISLRYVAALRGNTPKKTGTAFTYADALCAAPENLICLAASNPEGRFYGFVASDAVRRSAEEQAALRGIFNVIFMTGSPSEILARITNGSSLPPMLDFLCCDESAAGLPAGEATALFDLAQQRLNAGGLLMRAYRAYDEVDGALRFIVRQAAPEMNAAQKLEFLTDIKKLGGAHLAKNTTLSAQLDAATKGKAPEDFFNLFKDGKATSGAFDMLVNMGSRGFVYGGDATLNMNYVELAIPADAQDLIVSCKDSPLYEPIKDFALGRTTRSDIWVKAPAEKSADPAQLFGGFAYGLVVPRQQIPASFAAQGKNLDLSSPLYTKLLDLLTLMPIGVGDVLSHPSGAGENPAKILEALQIMVACGYVRPMRGALTATNNGNIAQPRLVGSYNRYLDKTDLTDKDVWFASQVMGCGVTLHAQEAFVIQALSRAGLNNSVSALMPELRRIANTDAGLSIINAKEPTAEIAHAMIKNIVGESLPQWYALALLEAA